MSTEFKWSDYPIVGSVTPPKDAGDRYRAFLDGAVVGAVSVVVVLWVYWIGYRNGERRRGKSNNKKNKSTNTG